MKRKKLGEVLQERGQISEVNLQKLFTEQEGKMVRLGELILERGLVEKASLIKALEDVSRVPYMDCTTVQCDAAVLQSVPKAMAVRLDALPVCMEQSKLVVVMAEPQNVTTIDELRFTTGKNISPRFGFRAEIQTAIVQNYDRFVSTAGARQAAEKITQEAHAEMEFVSTSIRQANRDAIEAIQVELHQKRTPAVRLVSEIIKIAMDKQASDIHIEPQSAATAVRIRVDGVLRELESVPETSRIHWSPGSRFSRTWTSESAVPRRTVASWWSSASERWTCACPHCPLNMEKKSSCGCWRPRRRS